MTGFSCQGARLKKKKDFFLDIPLFRCIFAHKNASINLIFSTINLIHFLHICKKGVLFLRGYEFFRLSTKTSVSLFSNFLTNRLHDTPCTRYTGMAKIAIFASEFKSKYTDKVFRHIDYDH